MKATEKLHNVGQSLWLDNITRDLVTAQTIHRHAFDHGAHVESDDLRPGDLEEHRVRS